MRLGCRVYLSSQPQSNDSGFSLGAAGRCMRWESGQSLKLSGHSESICGTNEGWLLHHRMLSAMILVKAESWSNHDRLHWASTYLADGKVRCCPVADLVARRIGLLVSSHGSFDTRRAGV